jgi:hypothetical protein
MQPRRRALAAPCRLQPAALARLRGAPPPHANRLTSSKITHSMSRTMSAPL